MKPAQLSTRTITQLTSGQLLSNMPLRPSLRACTGVLPFYQSLRSKSTCMTQLSTPVHLQGRRARECPTQQHPTQQTRRFLTTTKPLLNQNEPHNLHIQSTSPDTPTIHAVFEKVTGTWQYIVADPTTSTAVIIDPVLDYDPITQNITMDSADALLQLIAESGYSIAMILETHVHADHLTAASYLQSRLSHSQNYQPPIGIGKRVQQVQDIFGHRYGISRGEYHGVFGKLFDDDEVFQIGNLSATAIHLPGHTPDHLGYQIGDNVFCGDSVFHADIGTARCDFPGGSARDLFKSGRRLLEMQDDVKIWTGHDYPPEGRGAPVPCLTVAEHRRHNKHLMDGVTETVFVALREERDSKMAAPRLINQSLQINIRAGKLPALSEAGYRMLHLPLKIKGGEW